MICLRTCFKFLLRKCSSGPKDCSCDNHAGTFLLKLQNSLLEIWKCFDKTFATEKISINFSSVHLVCGFDTPDNLSCQSKKAHKVLNQPEKVKFTFIIIFSKCCTGHLNCAFENPEKNIFVGNPMFPFEGRKLSYKCSCFQIKI